MKKCFSLITSLCLWLSLATAVNLDSLWGVWNDKTQPDSNRLNAMFKIVIKGYLYSQPDSALYFAQIGCDFAETVGNKKGMATAYNIIGGTHDAKGNLEKALEYYYKGLKIYETIGNEKGIANVYNNIGLIYNVQGNYNKGVECQQKALKIREEIGDSLGISASFVNIGASYENQGNLQQAIQYYKKSMKIKEDGGCYNAIGKVYAKKGNFKEALHYFKQGLNWSEKEGNKYGVAETYNSIGNIYYELTNYEQAIDYYDKSVKAKEEIGDKVGLARTLGNIGLISIRLGNYEQAKENFEICVKLQEEAGDKRGISFSYSSIGEICAIQGDYELALEYFHKCLKIQEEIGNKDGMVYSYVSLANQAFEQKNYNEALALGKKGLALAQEVDLVISNRDISNFLYKVYKETKQFVRALEMHEIYIEMRDSLNSIENKEAAIKLEYQHQYEKEQALEEAKHQEQMALSAEREKRQQLIAWSAGGGLVMVLLFALFIFNRLQVTRRQKKVIEEQKDLVEEQKKDITDSIHYAENIQKALLPDAQELSLIPDGFVLFQPKDIVSGDFYWMQHHNDRVYLAACDCTGHGVPGAFMSMIGSSLLDEAVVEKGITQPNEIFFEVRKGFINALKQTGDTQKDGMDAVLIAWDKKSNLQLAAAYSPVLIIKAGEMKELKPDRQPVGFHTGEQKPFTHHELKLEKGDTVYIFSDGYPDQFGGPKDKKFMMKNFKKLLLSIQDKTMNEQKTILETTMAEWKGDTEQVDDILVMGVRF